MTTGKSNVKIVRRAAKPGGGSLTLWGFGYVTESNEKVKDQANRLISTG